MSNTKIGSFATSINVKYDIGKSEFIDRYLPTPAHAEALEGILKGFNEQRKHSHLIVGPYGTGKSLVGTLLAGLVSQRFNKQDITRLKNKFLKVHQNIYQQIDHFTNSCLTYIPVILNGNEGNLREALLKTILKSLNDAGITDLTLPGRGQKIIEVISNWEQEYPHTYSLFLQHIKENKQDINEWLELIVHEDKGAMDWFEILYPSLTAGAQLSSDFNDDSFLNKLIYISEQIKDKNLGLFIIYDEFGRYLQELKSDKVNETMQDLQNIAELFDKEVDNIHLLMIAHKNLGQYFVHLGQDYQNEFSRIEKRFKVYHIQSDEAAFIRITNTTLEKQQKIKLSSDDIDQHLKKLRKFNLFSELNHQEIENLVVKGSFPVHPVTLFLLPPLSSVFGQNERTLFTFLESDETGGLLNHINTSIEYYLADKLFDYFFYSSEESDLTDYAKEVLKLYKKVISKGNFSGNPLALRIIKLITIWQMAGLNSKAKMDMDLITYSFNLNEIDILPHLKELETDKLIRFNRTLGYWELFDSSNYDIYELAIEKKLHITNEGKIDVLNKALKNPFFFPNKYNDKKSMTRFALSKFIYASELLSQDFTLKKYLDERIRTSDQMREGLGKQDRKHFTDKKIVPDSIIFYVLINNESELNNLLQVLKFENYINPYVFYCIGNKQIADIENELFMYYACDYLLKDNELLKKDKNLKQELNLNKEDALYAIDQFVESFEKIDSGWIWIYQGEQINIKNRFIIEEKLDEIMVKHFELTPVVRNESFNRYYPSNQQLKAAYHVVDKLLQSHIEPEIGIQGFGPDYLIYATTFKNNKINLNDLNNLNDEPLELRKKLKSQLRNNPNGEFLDLVSVLANEPFGIRPPLIPLFLVGLLRDEWDKILFFINGAYIAEITGEILFEMIRAPYKYEYKYYLSEKYDDFLNLLSITFSDYKDKMITEKPVFIQVTRSLLMWLRSLPKVTQISNEMDPIELDFKDIIRRCEIDPDQSITDLYELLKESDMTISSLKMQLEGHFSRYLTALNKDVCSIFGISSINELEIWVKDKVPNTKRDYSIIKNINSTIGNLIENLSQEIVGIEIADWSDNMKNMFLNELKDFKNNLENHKRGEEAFEVSLNNQSLVIEPVELSNKAQQIYSNVYRTIKNAGRNVPSTEIDYLIIKLMKDFLLEN